MILHSFITQNCLFLLPNFNRNTRHFQLLQVFGELLGTSMPIQLNWRTAIQLKHLTLTSNCRAYNEKNMLLDEIHEKSGFVSCFFFILNLTIYMIIYKRNIHVWRSMKHFQNANLPPHSPKKSLQKLTYK